MQRSDRGNGMNRTHTTRFVKRWTRRENLPITTETAHFTILSVTTVDVSGSFVPPLVYHLTESVIFLLSLSPSLSSDWILDYVRYSNVTLIMDVNALRGLIHTGRLRSSSRIFEYYLLVLFDVKFSIIICEHYSRKTASFCFALHFVDECEAWQNHLVPVSSASKMYFPLNTSEKSESIYYFNEIEMPWQLDEWKIEVTAPTSTTEIWARLLENEYEVSKWNIEFWHIE